MAGNYLYQTRVKFLIMKMHFRLFWGNLVVKMIRWPVTRWLVKTQIRFEIERIFRKNLKNERRKGAVLTSEEIQSIRKKSIDEHSERMENELRKAEEGANKSEMRKIDMAVKLDQFMAFLIFAKIDKKQALHFAEEIQQLVDPNDLDETYRKVCSYIDNVKKLHRDAFSSRH